MSTEQKNQSAQTQAENKATGEMCDRIRNKGTMVGQIVVDREALESIVENRIDRALIERFEGMAGTIMQWQEDNPITGLDPDVLNKAVIATSNELILDMLFTEIQKLKD